MANHIDPADVARAEGTIEAGEMVLFFLVHTPNDIEATLVFRDTGDTRGQMVDPALFVKRVATVEARMRAQGDNASPWSVLGR